MIHIFLSNISAMNFQSDAKLVFYFIIKGLEDIRSFLQGVTQVHREKSSIKVTKYKLPPPMDLVGEGPHMSEWTMLNGVLLLFLVLTGKYMVMLTNLIGITL